MKKKQNLQENRKHKDSLFVNYFSNAFNLNSLQLSSFRI